MRSIVRTLFCGAVLAAGTLAAGQAMRLPAAWADAVDDKLAELKALEKDEGKCVAKMEEMKDSLDGGKISAAFKEMTKSKSDKIACAAIRILAGHAPADLDFQHVLLGKIDDKGLFEAKDGRPEVYKAALDGLASAAYKADKTAVLNVKKAQPDVMKFVDKFKGTNSEYAGRLIAVYGMVLDAFTVKDLLKLGEELDSAGGKGGGGGAGGGGGKGASADTRKILGETKKAVVDTLNAMTGQDIGDVPTWRKWWDEKGKTFKFPELGAAAPAAGAASAGAIVADAPEFKDAGYDFSVKKPDGKWWTWLKSDYTADETPRVELLCADPDDPKNMQARAYFIIHPMKNNPHDLKGMAKWALDNPLKEQLETDDAHGPPKVEEKKFGGFDWIVVAGMGQGIGNRKGWGSQYRRYYMTQIGTNILYIDAVCSTGADPETQTAFWKALETVTVPTDKKK